MEAHSRSQADTKEAPRSCSGLPPVTRPVGSAFHDGPFNLGSRGGGGLFLQTQSNCGAPDRHGSPEPWLVLWRTPPCCQLDQNGPHT